MEEYITNMTDENIDVETICTVCSKVFEEENIKDPVFSITFVDNAEIRRINKEYRDIDRETDVITFAFLEGDDMTAGGKFLGDIYISIDKAKNQAIEYGHSLKREISFLVVHGLLHTLGYDHMKEEDEKIMFGKQDKILEDLGIAR